MANIKQNDDGSTSLWNEQDGKEVFRVGGMASPASGGSQVSYRAPFTIKIPLTNAAPSTNNMASWLNPYPEALLIGETRLYVSTGQSATLSISAGTGSSATAFADNLIDTGDYKTAGLYNNITDNGTDGKSRQVLASGSYINVTSGSNTANTFVGTLYVDVIRT